VNVRVFLFIGALALLLPGCHPEHIGPQGGLGNQSLDDDDATHGDDDDVAGDDDDTVGDDDVGDDDAEDGPVVILYPQPGDQAPDPVHFDFEVNSPDIRTVEFYCEGWPLQDAPIDVSVGIHTHVYDFAGVNFERDVELIGYDADGDEVGTDQVSFVPADGMLSDQPGFNQYVVDAINDGASYPKDGTYPYCWSYYGDECGDMWGQIWGGSYLGEHVFGGGLDCFCSGHTLEVFLDAYERWQADHNAPTSQTYGDLTLDDVDVGDFYQFWQGFGVTYYASAADAFEYAGIGENVYEEDWDDVITGDFINLSRDTGTGHSVIFVDWVWDGMHRSGLRYYGCNGSGDSHPDPDDPNNSGGVSGPSFVTEYFTDFGGHVLTQWLFIGHPYDPATL